MSKTEHDILEDNPKDDQSIVFPIRLHRFEVLAAFATVPSILTITIYLRVAHCPPCHTVLSNLVFCASICIEGKMR